MILPHYKNSCSISSIFSMLSQMNFKSNDDLIHLILKYYEKENTPEIAEKLYRLGLYLVKKFYEKYNLNSDLKNAREILSLFSSTLYSNDSSIELNDYEKINDFKTNICFDYEQLKSLIEYNVNKKNVNIVSDENFDYNSEIFINGKRYIPRIYLIYTNSHYLTVVKKENFYLIYDDLRGIFTTDKINLNHCNVEFICYTID